MVQSRSWIVDLDLTYRQGRGTGEVGLGLGALTLLLKLTRKVNLLSSVGFIVNFTQYIFCIIQPNPKPVPWL